MSLARHERTKWAKSLFDFCTFETKVIFNCSDCYKNQHMYPNEWRTMACMKPHLVLWLKLTHSMDFWPIKKGFIYWPAKLIHGDENKIILFGHPKIMTVDKRNLSKSFIYSLQPPISYANQSDIDGALEVRVRGSV